MVMKKRCKCGNPLVIPATGRRPTYCSPACRQRAYWGRNKRVESAHNDNSELIRDVARLYLKGGDMVADVTYGGGIFWRKTDTSELHLLDSDLHHEDRSKQHDLRSLPYGDSSIDVLVLDPPYGMNTNKPHFEERYRNRESGRLDYKEVMALYRDGITEAARVLKVGGLLWVKCQDSGTGKRLRAAHVEIHTYAHRQGFITRDLFILVPRSKTTHWASAEQTQSHRTHSFLWVFQLTS
jgi:hypothetical protein